MPIPRELQKREEKRVSERVSETEMWDEKSKKREREWKKKLVSGRGLIEF